MTASSRQFRLPDLLASCPLKDATNPHYKEASAESRAWINGYNIFTDRKRAFFVQGSNELLCSHVYAYAGYEQLRTTCDFVNLLFVVDEVSDDQSGMDARATGQVFVKAMKYSDWDDGSILAKITKEFRARFLRLAGPRNVRRFAELCERYTDCVATEAELREQGEVLSTEAFKPLRRNNSAVLLCFSLVEYILGIDLDDEVYEDATFMEAYWAACDFVCWSNDVYSYDMEQSKGHTGNNIVTVLMTENHTSLQDTADYIGDYCKQLVDQYISAKKQLSPSLGPDAVRFVDALGQWMIGNLVWSFETVRYFGARHLQVKDSLIVCLRPRELHDDSGSESEED
ncbi:isoprenoid synthase domain-containing protein [Crassisporium funariophilum]|nr:isoprenoid synthase domain-containing protein [Crassisporium funariophilum]